TSFQPSMTNAPSSVLSRRCAARRRRRWTFGLRAERAVVNVGGSGGLRLGRRGGASLVDERGERRGIGDGEVREHLAVDFDPSRVEAGDEAAVGRVVQAARGVDPLDPQLAELTLAGPAIAERDRRTRKGEFRKLWNSPLRV